MHPVVRDDVTFCDAKLKLHLLNQPDCYKTLTLMHFCYTFIHLIELKRGSKGHRLTAVHVCGVAEDCDMTTGEHIVDEI